MSVDWPPLTSTKGIAHYHTWDLDFTKKLGNKYFRVNSPRSVIFAFPKPSTLLIILVSSMSGHIDSDKMDIFVINKLFTGVVNLKHSFLALHG